MTRQSIDRKEEKMAVAADAAILPLASTFWRRQ